MPAAAASAGAGTAAASPSRACSESRGRWLGAMRAPSGSGAAARRVARPIPPGPHCWEACMGRRRSRRRRRWRRSMSPRPRSPARFAGGATGCARRRCAVDVVMLEPEPRRWPGPIRYHAVEQLDLRQLGARRCRRRAPPRRRRQRPGVGSRERSVGHPWWVWDKILLSHTRCKLTAEDAAPRSPEPVANALCLQLS